MTLLALSFAFALERPVLDAAADAACPVRGVKAGVALTPTCEGVVLSMARARWYVEMADFADYQSDLRTVEAAVRVDETATAADREDYWRKLAEAPPPKLSPAAWFGLGVGAGVTTVLLGALAVRAVAEAPLYESP